MGSSLEGAAKAAAAKANATNDNKWSLKRL